MDRVISPLTRIGVFFDGSFTNKVSNYYNFEHQRKSHLSFRGIHDFIKQRVAEKERKEPQFCQIVESHYFRGRFSLTKAREFNRLETDRFIDQLLMNNGIVTHYFPMNERVVPPEEKGIDVWLSLEAYDMAMRNKFDVFALVAGDLDFVPLARKLNGLGVRVMLLGFDLQWQTEDGRAYRVNTSQTLIEEASYPILVSQEIDSRAARGDRLIDGLFADF